MLLPVTDPFAVELAKVEPPMSWPAIPPTLLCPVTIELLVTPVKVVAFSACPMIPPTLIPPETRLVASVLELLIVASSEWPTSPPILSLFTGSLPVTTPDAFEPVTVPVLMLPISPPTKPSPVTAPVALEFLTVAASARYPTSPPMVTPLGELTDPVAVPRSSVDPSISAPARPPTLLLVALTLASLDTALSTLP